MGLSLPFVYFKNIFSFVETNEMENDPDYALYCELRAQPDFDCFPIPISWFKKFNIPARAAENTKDFLSSCYTVNKAIEPKDLPPIIIDKPQQNGKLYEMVAPEDVKVDVVQKPFECEDLFATLPSLRDDENGIPKVIKELSIDGTLLEQSNED